MEKLRFLTYLAPSIPLEFFECVVAAVAERTGSEATLESERSVSGPTEESDPFRSGRADLAFVCAPSYPPLARIGSADLVGAAPVPVDPRAKGRPVYFADVIVAGQEGYRRFRDLAGATWTYNDPNSLSGWHSMLLRLRQIGHTGPPDTFFGEVRVSGSHRASVRLVADEVADASAIDSNALALQLAEDPVLAARVRVLETWGPLPIQPLLASRSLDGGLQRAVADALVELDRDPEVAREIKKFGFARFAPVDPAFYESFHILE